jgi:hypothetical protein
MNGNDQFEKEKNKIPKDGLKRQNLNVAGSV